MEKLLNEWGFPELLQSFLEQEIDEEALLSLEDPKLLETIIPKVGPRIKFFAKVKNYQAISKADIIFELTDLQEQSTKSPCVPDNDEDNRKKEQPCSSPTSSSSEFEVQLPNNNDLKKSFNRASKRQHAFSGEAGFKKACSSVYNLDLSEFLQQTIPGNFVLNTYREGCSLTRKTRSQLTSLLISGLLAHNAGAHLTSLDFEVLSDKICEVFPKENKSTYFIARVPGTKKTRPVSAKGKLIDKYRNLRRAYNLCNTYNNNATSIDEETSNESKANDEDLLRAKLWLKNYQEPWETVMENWKNTFSLRKTDKSSTINEVYIQWPILKHRDAYNLINSDFQQLYPNCQISVFTDYGLWEFFFTNVKSKSPSGGSCEEFLSPLLDPNISQDSKNAIQLTAFPMLFPPTGRIRCKKVHWKPSIIECQESLINRVSNCGDIQEFISKRNKKLQEYELTNQPYIIVVGTSVREITDAYVVIDSSFYRAYSVLHALDFTFKVFHALDAKYPKECEHIWLLIERLLYKINASIIGIPAVLTLINDLEQS